MEVPPSWGPEGTAKYNKKYREAHREELRAAARARYAADPESHKAARRAWRAEHLEAERELDRSRKRDGRAQNTAYAERVRAHKRSAEYKEQRNATRRTPEQRARAAEYAYAYRTRPAAAFREAARVAVGQALKRGTLVRPTCCVLCGAIPRVAADGRSSIRADHYLGYEKVHWLDVQWICTTCDGVVTRARRKTEG